MLRFFLGWYLVFSFFLGFHCSFANGASKKEDTENLLLLGIAGNIQNGNRASTTRDLAWESHEDYNQNQYGLITPNTLKSWLENWENTRPSHIPGKLVVLQNTNGTTKWNRYLKGEGANTKVYAFDFGSSEDGFVQTRNNGLVDTISIIPNGERMDQLLNLYGIDPVRDLIVLASSSNAPNHYMTTLRAFYAFYYWGMDKKNLAVLNGTLHSPNIHGGLPSSQELADIPPALNRVYSVRSLRQDNTVLMLSLEETKQAVGNPHNHNLPLVTGGIFVSDARSESEYNGTSDAGGPKTNDTRFMGTLKGAKHTPWQNFLTGTPDHAFKGKALLEAIYSQVGYNPGDTIIHLCKTNYRAQITGFATIGILGYPTTYYDGGWLEWGNIVATGNYPTVLESSPFRTDHPQYTDNLTENTTFNPSSPLTPPQPDILATTTRRIQEEDKAYKRGR